MEDFPDKFPTPLPLSFPLPFHPHHVHVDVKSFFQTAKHIQKNKLRLDSKSTLVRHPHQLKS